RQVTVSIALTIAQAALSNCKGTRFANLKTVTGPSSSPSALGAAFLSRAIATSTATGLKSQIEGRRVTTEKKSTSPKRRILFEKASSPIVKTERVLGAINSVL